MGATSDARTIEMAPGESAQHAWGRLYDDTRFMAGNGGYSGTLAEKPGIAVVGTWNRPTPPTKEQLAAATSAVSGEPWEEASRPDRQCRQCYGRKEAEVTEWVVAESDGARLRGRVARPCPDCGATGRVSRTPEELAQRAAQAVTEADALAGFGISSDQLAEARRLWDDKWGIAIALVYGRTLWVSGMCSD